MEKIIEVPNEVLPIAKTIKELLAELPIERKDEILEGMTEEEYIELKVVLFLEEWERALSDGALSPAGAEEIATSLALTDFAEDE